MSDKMKLIMESFRKNVIQEETMTVGTALTIISKFREAKAGKKVIGKGLEMAIEQFPGINNLYSLWKAGQESKEMLSDLYGADDSFKTNTGLDRLNVDDNVSKIVDDKIETAFLNFLIKKLSSMNPTDEIPNATEELQIYLSKHKDLGGHTVKK